MIWHWRAVRFHGGWWMTTTHGQPYLAIVGLATEHPTASLGLRDGSLIKAPTWRRSW